MSRSPNALSPDEPSSALRRIPIWENGEPLINFLELSRRLYWAPRHPVFDYQRFRLARRSVAEMLARAAECLPDGLRLAIVEAWRPPEIQRQMRAATRERLSGQHPEWGPRYLSRVVDRFSAPMDTRVPPPHTTGGAVGLHLVDAAGQPLDLTSPYGLGDPRGAWADAAGLSAEAERNRALLREALLDAGLTSYPAEWWHWSYGDQGWAYRGRHPVAIYGAVEPPGLEHADLAFRPHDDPGW